MSNRSKVGKDFIKKDKEKAELRAKAKVKEKINKSGPPSKKELVNKARDLMSKRETMITSSKSPNLSKKVNQKLNKYDLSSRASMDIGRMLDNRMGSIGQRLSNVSEPLRDRQKLIEELKKKGAAKQVPKSMNMGGVMKARGGTFKGTY